MKLQDVILRAMSGELSWQPTSWACSRGVCGGGGPACSGSGMTGCWTAGGSGPRRGLAPFEEVERILRLYRERYAGFNVRPFHQLVRRDEHVSLSYSFVKTALQRVWWPSAGRGAGTAGAAGPGRAFGKLLHIDGSPHAWLALCPAARQTLIAVLDDATKRLLYAQLHPAETTPAVMTALGEVFRTCGLPIALYSDRAAWAFLTPKAGGPVDRTRLTHLGRALAHLGIEHIGAYSPQARGRGERLNRTLQDQLVNELRLAGIATLAAANAYLREHFIPDYNARFSHPPAEPTPAFVALGDVDLDQILCEEEERVVAPDNTVSFDIVEAGGGPRRVLRANRRGSPVPGAGAYPRDLPSAGRHPYVVHFETKPRAELRGFVDVREQTMPRGRPAPMPEHHRRGEPP